MIFRKIEPTDVLFFRGNRLFGGAGEHGEAQMPPWPSVFAGAVASRVLADKGLIPKITKNPNNTGAILEKAVGGDFACTFVGLLHDGKALLPMPADLVCLRTEKNDGVKIASLVPQDIPDRLKASACLPKVPVLQYPERAKAETGLWMNTEGWKRHLNGEKPESNNFASSSELWALDSRLGIARDFHTKTAEEGRIYTTEAVALKPDVTFLVGFSGSDIPKSGLLRLGGDGRGAVISEAGDIFDHNLGKPESGWSGFRMILITPGLFPLGWLPPGCAEENGTYLLHIGSLRARLEAAVIGRPQTVSGWDMANHQPKPAQKAVPQGSVFWFRVEEGDTAELTRLWQEGLYAVGDNVDEEYLRSRQREGFSRAWFGKWEPKD